MFGGAVKTAFYMTAETFCEKRIEIEIFNIFLILREVLASFPKRHSTCSEDRIREKIQKNKYLKIFRV